VAAGVQGLVVAATGNGMVHRALDAALQAAEAAGVTVWRTTRCAQGALVGPVSGPAGAMSPWQARLELTLSLLASRGGG
jgi:L-asparaginase